MVAPVRAARPEVGGGVLVRRLFGKGFVFACAADGKVSALGAQGGGFVAVGGDLQLVGYPSGEVAGERYAFFQGDAGDGDQGQHVGRAHAGMLSVVLPHVYDFRGLPDSGERGLDHGLGFAHEGDHGAVGGLSGVNVEDLDSACGFDGPDYLAYLLLVAPLAEVGDALDYALVHFGVVLWFVFSSVGSGLVRQALPGCGACPALPLDKVSIIREIMAREGYFAGSRERSSRSRCLVAASGWWNIILSPAQRMTVRMRSLMSAR